MGTLEEFFHIFRVAAEAVVFGVSIIIKFNGTNWSQSAFVAKDKVDSFLVNEAISFLAILVADLVAEQIFETDVRDDIKTFTKNIVEQLKTATLVAGHETAFGAVLVTTHSLEATTFRGDCNDKRENQKGDEGNSSNNDENSIHKICVQYLRNGLVGR